MIHLIGSSGFIGKAIKKAGKHRDDIIYYSSNKLLIHKEKYKFFNITDESTWKNIEINNHDKLIFLSWRNLPNYDKSFHINENLIESIKFFSYVLQRGISKIIVAGTCYEYGIQNGMLSEEADTYPVNSYSIAKDCLRKASQSLCNSFGKDLAWLRIFYPYGEGQNPKSLIPSLETAIKNKSKFFDTSQGDQIRDFIKVENVAKIFLKITDSSYGHGVFNVGSGEPISIRDFLEDFIEKKGSKIKLNRGAYPYRTDEPLAFWADTSKISSLK